MDQKGFRKLRIDEEFRTLIRPLRKEEYSMLEANLALDGCREAIITWRGIIIDGHNRYEICNRLGIPYAVIELSFDSRDEVIIWICSNQLGRRNITEETRKYLIGKQYELEKAISYNRNHKGVNQYSADGIPSTTESKMSGRRTANRLGLQYHVSSGAVRKYGEYSTALEKIAEKAPEIVPQILSGNYKISHNNIVALSEMEPDEMRMTTQKLSQGNTSFIRYSDSRKDFSGEESIPELPIIKTMPAFDPDAEIAGLTLTIPSWTSSIERVINVADWTLVSQAAREKLGAALIQHHHEVLELLRIARGEK